MSWKKIAYIYYFIRSRWSLLVEFVNIINSHCRKIYKFLLIFLSDSNNLDVVVELHNNPKQENIHFLQKKTVIAYM